MIELATTAEQVHEAAHLFDDAARDDAVRRFLRDPSHHLLLARDGGRVVGFVSGVETTHPDKGTEMLLYELAVDDAAQRQGHGRALVEALADLARGRGCYGMWVLTDADNDAALATYRSGGATAESTHVMLAWDLADGSG
jgi:ribosomal protein S18 acetylase RimI-like enzyme